MEKKNKRTGEERRLVEAEFRVIENESGEMEIEGYPILFDTPATHWGFTEIIDKKALEECDISDVPLRYNHEESFLILARTRNDSLKLDIDEKGLKMTAKLIDTQSNKDVYKSIMAKLLDKMSFGFTPEEELYNNETDTRTITKIEKLWDVSVVDVPYYDETSVYARKLDTSKDFGDKLKLERRRSLASAMKKVEERRTLLAKLK